MAIYKFDDYSEARAKTKILRARFDGLGRADFPFADARLMRCKIIIVSSGLR